MLEYAGSQRAGLSTEREAPHPLAVLRSFDWILVVGVAALVLVGLWGVAGITKFAVPNDPSYYLNRQILYACVGAVVLVAAALIDPDLYRRYWRAIFAGTCRGRRLRAARSGTRRTARRAGSTSASSPSSRRSSGSSSSSLALAGMLSERAARPEPWGTTLKVVGLGLVPVLLVFVQPDLGTALVYIGRARGDAVRRRDAVAAPRRARQPSSWSSWSASSGPARRPESACSRATRCSA